MLNNLRNWNARTSCAAVVVCAVALLLPMSALAQIRAVARTGGVPPWDKGILPINAESYYNAIECGKQGGADPPCVFWDTGLCKNEDFALAFFTPYKMVAYEVWAAVRAKQTPPQPNYLDAQQTRITVGVSPVKGTKNQLTNLVLKRGTRVIAPVDQSVDATSRRFTFDYPAFAATGPVTLDLVGKTRTISCLITQAVLTQLR